ncbi:thioredoxin domain-containing protein 12 [Octopus bimaculoides]|uniref:Thioredoxin domain-containing protein 12 n=1 Tax=Octopus bimaculoides TaxID=37653 RepID=A0A0L8HTP2_OCTBM|nr:thioredoxin domain-containing protein 12 [Octopus bimaculoides]|eukprot:XP_014769483.1 PREDICTED: thioredoxin domain-containing protein 12-like [Octopus bimaculoides]
MAAYTVILFIFSVQLTLCLCNENDLANGWGDHIAWHNLQDGLKKSKNQNKSLMFILHKSWCGACKALKPKFADSEEIGELSKEFIMVNSPDDQDSKYSPDGGYIPRILFLDSNGDVMLDFFNEEGNPNYKYYYPAISQVLTSMKNVLKAIKNKAQGEEL